MSILSSLFQTKKKTPATPAAAAPTSPVSASPLPSSVDLNKLGDVNKNLAAAFATVPQFNTATLSGKSAPKVTAAGAKEQADIYNAAQGVQNQQNLVSSDIYRQAVEGEVAGVKQAKGTLKAGAEKVDKYAVEIENQAKANVANAKLRAYQVRDQITKLGEEARGRMDKGKVDALAAGAFNALGTMKEQDKSIAETYGVDSSEYRMFQQEKSSALQHVSNEIRAAYADKVSAFDAQQIQITAQTETQMAELTQLHEKTYVDVLGQLQNYAQQYTLQLAGAEATMAQLEATPYKEYATFIRDLPLSIVDMMPLVSAVADSIAEQQLLEIQGMAAGAQVTAANSMTPQTSPNVPQNWQYGNSGID